MHARSTKAITLLTTHVHCVRAGRHEIVLLHEAECADMTTMRNVACGKPPTTEGSCKEAIRRVATCHSDKKFSSHVLNTLRLGAWTRSVRKRRLDYRVDCNNRTVRERAEQLLQSARRPPCQTQILRSGFIRVTFRPAQQSALSALCWRRMPPWQLDDDPDDWADERPEVAAVLNASEEAEIATALNALADAVDGAEKHEASALCESAVQSGALSLICAYCCDDDRSVQQAALRLLAYFTAASVVSAEDVNASREVVEASGVFPMLVENLFSDNALTVALTLGLMQNLGDVIDHISQLEEAGGMARLRILAKLDHVPPIATAALAVLRNVSNWHHAATRLQFCFVRRQKRRLKLIEQAAREKAANQVEVGVGEFDVTSEPTAAAGFSMKASQRGGSYMRDLARAARAVERIQESQRPPTPPPPVFELSLNVLTAGARRGGGAPGEAIADEQTVAEAAASVIREREHAAEAAAREAAARAAAAREAKARQKAEAAELAAKEATKAAQDRAKKTARKARAAAEAAEAAEARMRDEAEARGKAEADLEEAMTVREGLKGELEQRGNEVERLFNELAKEQVSTHRAAQQQQAGSATPLTFPLPPRSLPTPAKRQSGAGEAGGGGEGARGAGE